MSKRKNWALLDPPMRNTLKNEDNENSAIQNEQKVGIIVNIEKVLGLHFEPCNQLPRAVQC